MNRISSTRFALRAAAVIATTLLAPTFVAADAVTDWNEYAVEATKGFDGTSGTGLVLDSNLSSRIEAIAARAVFDAANSILQFSPRGYYYAADNAGSAEAAVAQAAHDVLLGLLPDPALDTSVDAKWSRTRGWLDARLQSALAGLGLPASDGGISAGKAAALAALTARRLDNASPVTSYGPQLIPTTNPGIGVWRQSNAAAVYVNSATAAPTGFDAAGTTIQGRPGVDLNWRDVATFSLTNAQRAYLVAQVPLSPVVGSPEYRLELDYVRKHGQDSAPPSVRSADQTAQALYYKQDAEIFVNELARVASRARALGLAENARLFALLDSAVADARTAAFASKYEQKFWRPITALNADANGGVTNGYAAWHPVAATPSHPSNTAGHSATGAAAAEVLRAFFGDDRIRPDGGAVTLGSLSWLAKTNAGTGITASRAVTTFSQVQLENGASRLYLGVHFGYDNYQGQLLGLSVADTVIAHSDDPAAEDLAIKDSRASLTSLARTLLARPDLYGFFGRETR